MSGAIISVEGLGKRYRIGSRRPAYFTLGEGLAGAAGRLAGLLRGAPAPRTEDLWALRDVSFQVQTGEVVGIVGRNGAGKSTLLKILSRITEPTEGRATLRGRVGSLLEVGTGFHGELSGRENIYLSGAILGMRKAEIDRQFDAIVAFAGVERFLDTPIKHYSSGMNVRLGFAVAAHLDPEILLVDEVLAVGDAEFQKKCLGKMGEVARGGRTVLFVSHNMAAVTSFCQRGIFLSGGRAEVIGSAAEAVSAYLSGGANAAACTDLAHHPNRVRSCRPLLTSLVLESQGNAAAHGAPFAFRIGYDFPEEVRTPQFSVGFQSVTGVTVFTVISDYQDNNIPAALQGRGEVCCRIDSLPLLPGRYSLDVMLWQPGQRLDCIESAVNMEVVWLNAEDRRVLWNSSLGLVYVDARWRLG